MSADSFYRGFGGRVATRRTALRLSQQQLADAVGLSRPSVANIECGRQQVLAHMVVRLASALRVTADDLLGTLPHTRTRIKP